MKYLNLFVILIVALSFLQFKPEEKLVRIREEVSLKTKFKQFYTYTSSGRIASLITSFGDTLLYEYVGNRIVMQSTRNATTDTLELNDHNYVEVYKGRNFVFDENGFRIQESSVTGTFFWNISKGNISRYMLIGNYGGPKLTSTYLYYPDKENCISNANKGQDFLGQDSKNLINETVVIGANGDTLIHNTNHYEFDTLGRVTKKIVYKKSEAKTDSFAYIYY